MAKKVLEKHIEKEYCDWLIEEYRGCALKLVLLSARGFPDRTVLCDGKIFFIEFKQLTGTYGGLQKAWRKRLQKLGFEVFEFRTIEQAKRKTRLFFNEN